MRILVTGGSGYIGAHTCEVLLTSACDLVILDDLSNSCLDVIARLVILTGHRPLFVEGDVRDRVLLRNIFSQHKFDAVIHFAGLKSVGESVVQPLRYYDCNVGGTLVLCEAMAEAGVKTLIFSSSATVYGDPAFLPIREDFPRSTTNPYGASKLMLEDMLADIAKSDPQWSIACLRYFNPIGAHESGLIGEAPSGIPNNLMPYIAQVASGQRECLSVYGDDYPTPDGTGVRDYIHVVDLAEAHVRALEYASTHQGAMPLNLGTGRGYSVLELVHAFEKASGHTVPLDVVARRAGDVAELWADPRHAQSLLGWSARRDVACMCEDAWRWQSANPSGYSAAPVSV